MATYHTNTYTQTGVFRLFNNLPTINRQRTVNDMEKDIVAHKRHAILAGCILLIMRTRIKGQRLSQHLDVSCRKQLTQFVGQYNLQPLPLMIVGKSATCLRMTVDVCQIGLDIINRCAIHQVSTQHLDGQFLHINMVNTYRRQAQIIRTER